MKTFSNGDKYEGEFLNGVPNGFGTLQTSGGWRLDGNFVNGKPEGDCRMTGNGYAFRGNFSNGVMNGHITAEYPPMQGLPNARVEADYKNGVLQFQDIFLLDGKHVANVFDHAGNFIGTMQIDDQNHARWIGMSPAVINAATGHAVTGMGFGASVSSAPGTTQFIMIPGYQR